MNFNVAQLAEGVYIIKVNANGKKTVAKFVIKRWFESEELKNNYFKGWDRVIWPSLFLFWNPHSFLQETEEKKFYQTPIVKTSEKTLLSILICTFPILRFLWCNSAQGILVKVAKPYGNFSLLNLKSGWKFGYIGNLQYLAPTFTIFFWACMDLTARRNGM